MSNRRDLSAQKYNLLKAYDKLSKMSIRKAAVKLNVHRTTLTRILKDRTNVVRAAKGNCCVARKLKRSTKEESVDIALKEWFLKERDKNSPVSGLILRKKAEELAKQLGKDNFIATDIWFQRWKKREKIVFGKGFKVQLDANQANKFKLESFDFQTENKNDNKEEPSSQPISTSESPNEFNAVQPCSREELHNASNNETFGMRAPVSTQSSTECPPIPLKLKNPLQNNSHIPKQKETIPVVDDEMKNFVKSYGMAISKGLETLPTDVAIEFSLKVLKDLNEKALEAKFEQKSRDDNENGHDWCSASGENEYDESDNLDSDAEMGGGQGVMPIRNEKPNGVPAILESIREEPNIVSNTVGTVGMKAPFSTRISREHDTNKHKEMSTNLKKPPENQSPTVQDNNMIPSADDEMKNFVKSYGLAISRGLETLPGDVTIGVALNILKELNEKVLETKFKHSARSVSDCCDTGMDDGDQEVLPKEKENISVFLDTPIKIEPDISLDNGHIF